MRFWLGTIRGKVAVSLKVSAVAIAKCQSHDWEYRMAVENETAVKYGGTLKSTVNLEVVAA